MSNKKNNTKNVSENVWEKNKIPPLEFCSIERAAQLLDCQINDIYHWINTSKIFPSVFFDSHVNVNIHAHIMGDEIAEIEAIRWIYSEIQKPTIISIDYGVRSYSVNDHGCAEDVELYDNGRYKYEHGANSLTKAASICGLWTPSFYNLWSSDSSQFINSENSIFLPYDTDKDLSIIYATLLDNIEISASNLMLTKADIDRIYQAGQGGHELATLKPLSGQDEAEERVKLTLNDSLLIIGGMISALKQATPQSKRWSQEAISYEMLGKLNGTDIKKRDIDDYFSEANKRLKSIE